MNKTFRKIVGGALAVTALMGLAACGSKTEGDKAEGKTYKVGIVQFVDDASLNQIEAAIEAELDAKAKELGGTISIKNFVRFEKGEGIEKRQDDLAEEVAKLVK